MLSLLKPYYSTNLRLLRRFSSESFQLISQNDYESISEHTLEHLYDYLDQLPDKINTAPDFDVSYAMGVLTAKISKEIGTYVINKQSPNRQIWLSSPLSGPKRYDYMDNKWIYRHDGVSLHTLLQEEFQNIFKADKICIIDLEKELKL